MDKIIMALAPVFSTGFAIQQLLEIPGTLIDIFGGEKSQQFKKVILGMLGAIVGCLLVAWLHGLRGLKILLTHSVTDSAGKVTTVVPDIKAYVDVPVTGLILSAGTEGLNSILKFLKYSKEDKKNDAASSNPKNAGPGAPGPDKALEGINLK